jgi:hypothetical protein
MTMALLAVGRQQEQSEWKTRNSPMGAWAMGDGGQFDQNIHRLATVSLTRTDISCCENEAKLITDYRVTEQLMQLTTDHGSLNLEV